MSSEFASDQEIFKRAREEVERKSGKTPEELYAEREKRVMDAIAMKEPDRVPVVMRGGYFPVMYAGLSPSVVFYEPTVYKQAVIKTLLDFEPDSFQLMTNVVSGGALGALDSIQN